jgi:hypothetical protein
MPAASIEFDRQDEGHTAHGPLTWSVIEKHYLKYGNHPYKKYDKTRVLTGPFGGTQSNNRELVQNHYYKTDNWNAIKKIMYQRTWQR